MTEPTFEQQLNQLEKIVSDLESGERPLANALEDFKTGVNLVTQLQKTLVDAETTLAQVIDADGNLKALELTND